MPRAFLIKKYHSPRKLLGCLSQAIDFTNYNSANESISDYLYDGLLDGVIIEPQSPIKSIISSDASVSKSSNIEHISNVSESTSSTPRKPTDHTIETLLNLSPQDNETKSNINPLLFTNMNLHFRISHNDNNDRLDDSSQTGHLSPKSVNISNDLNNSSSSNSSLELSSMEEDFAQEKNDSRSEDEKIRNSGNETSFPWNILLDSEEKPHRRNESMHYNCDGCGKTYATFSGLSKHKRFHCAAEVKREFGCRVCDKSYSSLGALKMHIRTHTLPCKCPLCGKAFSRPWLLQGHIRTHTGEKPFQCELCLRTFADRSNLRAHLQTHEDIKKYCCTVCNKTFSRMSLLSKHKTGNCCRISR